MKRRKIKSDDGGGALATQFLALSLFIMLLAFFIVLTASSDTTPVKSAPLIESLEKTFASKIEGMDKKPAKVEDKEQSTGQGQSLESIKGLLKSQGLPFTVEKMEGNSLMYLRMRREDFINSFGIKEKKLTREQSVFLSKLLILLRPSDKVLTYSVDVFVGLGENPAQMALEYPDKTKSSVVLADKLASLLIAQKFPKKLITIGLHQGAAGYIDMYFKPFKKEQ
jgi:hypothetical protein